MRCRYVLVVDDDPAVRHALAATLSDAGFPVREAGDGAEALELIERARPALVFLDLRMPGVDGWALAAALLTRGIDVPLVVMTGTGVGHSAARKLEARGYLAKPFAEQDVLRLLEECWEEGRDADP